MIKFSLFTKLHEAGGSVAGKFEVLELDAPEAKEIANFLLTKNNLKIDKSYPNFSRNFKTIKEYLARSIGTARKNMPVITSYQVDDFKKHLDKENIKSVYKYQTVDQLKPIQGQVYFDKLINAEIEFGGIKQGSAQTEKPMIVSRDGYIIDGHHRWATAMLTDQKIKMKTLTVDMDIHALLKYALYYGVSIGNKPND